MSLRLLLPVLLCAAAFALACGAYAQRPSLPTPILPDGLGVNIHFTDPRPGEMKMLADGGFTWVRMDFAWGATEREKGVYDFSAYDRLLAALEPRGVRPIFILDYTNPFYDDNRSPYTEEGRQAMARWAAAAAGHFQGRGILWEMYNEPNISFWRPKPNVDDYVKLAIAVGRAIRETTPEELYIGPATSTMDFTFLEACFKGGLLEYWDAVSVHPYRQNDPETVIPEYRQLRLLIKKYAPGGKSIPIISGEWGYSVAWSGMDEEKQAKRLARQWLVNICNDVPLSIWYDWHDDGPDPKEPEHHFGTTLYPYYEGREPVYDPKPSYKAAKTLSDTLRGFRFNKRLAIGGPDDFVLLFSKGEEVRLAVWTTTREPRPAIIPASPGGFRAVGLTGQAAPSLSADRKGLAVILTDAPVYLVPEQPNALLRAAVKIERLPLEIVSRAPAKVKVGNTIHSVNRVPDPVPLRATWKVAGGSIAQETRVSVTNPLRVTIPPLTGDVLPVRVDNPSGESFTGSLALTAKDMDAARKAYALRLDAGETEAILKIPAKKPLRGSYRVGATLKDAGGKVIMTVPAVTYTPVDDLVRFDAGSIPTDYRLTPDGDAQVVSEQTLTADTPPEGPPGPGAGALRITYRFEPGWKFIQLKPETDALKRIEAKPKAVGMWVYGDGSGNWIRLRFTDSTDQTFQPGGEPITWKGWRYIVIPMTEEQAGHWGGAQDGVIHYPIRWDTLFLLDSATRNRQEGAVYMSAPTLVY